MQNRDAAPDLRIEWVRVGLMLEARRPTPVESLLDADDLAVMEMDHND